MFVANALNKRLTYFKRPHYGLMLANVSGRIAANCV
jgi:hypothetical protein